MAAASSVQSDDGELAAGLTEDPQRQVDDQPVAGDQAGAATGREATESGRDRAVPCGEQLEGVLQLVLDLVGGEDQHRRGEDDESAVTALEEPDDGQHEHEERGDDLGLPVVAHLGQQPHRRVQPVGVARGNTQL